VKPAASVELRYWRFWALGGLALALVILVLSLMPAEQLPEVRISDKVEHILAYVALAFWFGSICARRRFVWIALMLIGYGLLVELLQGGMGWGRQADLYDLIADAAGIAAGLLLAMTPLGGWARWLESWQRQLTR
jgi:VanZ family protein